MKNFLLVSNKKGDATIYVNLNCVESAILDGDHYRLYTTDPNCMGYMVKREDFEKWLFDDKEDVTVRYQLQNGYGKLVDANECKEKILKYGFRAPDMTVTEFVEDMLTTVIPEDDEKSE